jgi:hypothetical protein
MFKRLSKQQIIQVDQLLAASSSVLTQFFARFSLASLEDSSNVSQYLAVLEIHGQEAKFMMSSANKLGPCY